MYIWTWIFESRPIRGSISLCFTLSTLSPHHHWWTLCLFVCVRERRGVKRERLVHWTNHANRAELHPVPVKCKEIEPSAAFCSTAASAKTQYVGSRGPRWQELSPQRISSASLYCVLLIWLVYPYRTITIEGVKITAWWIGRNWIESWVRSGFTRSFSTRVLCL